MLGAYFKLQEEGLVLSLIGMMWASLVMAHVWLHP